jgi:hypothetical protein
MFLQDFSKNDQAKITAAMDALAQEHNISLHTNNFSKNTLEKLAVVCENNLTNMRNTNNKYHRNPEYSKYINLQQVAKLCLSEGIYAQSPNMLALKDMIGDVVQDLMGHGYDSDEAEKECMNRYRGDSRFAFNDEYVLPMVQEAIMEFIESCNESCMIDEVTAELAEQPTQMEEIMTLENQIQTALAEGNVHEARELMSELKTRRIEEAKKKNMVKDPKTGKMVPDYAIDGEGKDDLANESMFDSIVDEVLSEDVDLDQAEVVLATQGMGSDVQDMNEKVGRMQNEDIVAIADQVRKEQGQDAANQFLNQMNGALATYMEAGKAAKAQIDSVVGMLSGETPAIGADLGDLGDQVSDQVSDEEVIDMNEPAAAGPIDQPLGRAEL